MSIWYANNGGSSMHQHQHQHKLLMPPCLHQHKHQLCNAPAQAPAMQWSWEQPVHMVQSLLRKTPCGSLWATVHFDLASLTSLRTRERWIKSHVVILIHFVPRIFANDTSQQWQSTANGGMRNMLLCAMPNDIRHNNMLPTTSGIQASSALAKDASRSHKFLLTIRAWLY